MTSNDQYIRADSHLCEGCNEVLTISIETIMASTSLHDESHLNCPGPRGEVCCSN